MALLAGADPSQTARGPVRQISGELRTLSHGGQLLEGLVCVCVCVCVRFCCYYYFVVAVASGDGL